MESNGIVFVFCIFVTMISCAQIKEPSMKADPGDLINKMTQLQTKGIKLKDTINNLKNLINEKDKHLISQTKLNYLQTTALKQLESLPKSCTNGKKERILNLNTRSLSSCDYQKVVDDVTIIFQETFNISLIMSLEAMNVYNSFINCTKMSPFQTLSCILTEIGKAEALLPEVIEELQNYIDNVQAIFAEVVDYIKSCFGSNQSKIAKQILSVVKDATNCV